MIQGGAMMNEKTRFLVDECYDTIKRGSNASSFCAIYFSSAVQTGDIALLEEHQQNQQSYQSVV